jgi:hypothetical protein
MKPSKREVFDQLLAARPDESIFVMFDPRVKGASVPPHLAPMTSVMLEIGLNMIVPIKDLLSHAGGFSGVFSFNRVPAYVHVPWSAVFWIGRDVGRESVMGVDWPEDRPADLVPAGVREAAKSGVHKRPRELPKGWRVIEGGGNGEPSGPQTRGVA